MIVMRLQRNNLVARTALCITASMEVSPMEEIAAMFDTDRSLFLTAAAVALGDAIYLLIWLG